MRWFTEDSERRGTSTSVLMYVIQFLIFVSRGALNLCLGIGVPLRVDTLILFRTKKP